MKATLQLVAALLIFGFLIFMGCNDNSKKETQSFSQTLKMASNGNGYIEKANGDTLFFVKRDTTVSWTYTITDTFTVAKSGVTPPPPPPQPVDTSTTETGYTVFKKYNMDAGTVVSKTQCNRCGISTDIKKSGTGSFHFYYKQGDPAISSGNRDEWQFDGSESPLNTDLIYEWDQMFTQLTAPGGVGNVAGLSVQWHGTTQGTSGPGGFLLYGGEYQLGLQPDGCNGCGIEYQSNVSQYPTINVQLNVWYHIKVKARWATSGGYVEVYLTEPGKAQRLYYKKPNAKYAGTKTSDGTKPYLKIGANMFSPNNTIEGYIDNLVISRK